jgi:hypothetical protein
MILGIADVNKKHLLFSEVNSTYLADKSNSDYLLSMVYTVPQPKLGGCQWILRRLLKKY